MNKIQTISDRAQQIYISKQQTVFLLKTLRLCPCDDEVGCIYCEGLGQYYDTPVVIKGILANGSNRSEKKKEYPELDFSEYELTIHPKYEVAKGDRVIPFNINIYETFEEKIDKDTGLSFHPARGNTVSLYFMNEGSILTYKNGFDFSIAKEGLLNSRTITWIIPPPANRARFVARYQRVPEYVLKEIPEAKIAEGKRIMPSFKLTKLLAPSETNNMVASGDKAATTITTGGMTHE